MVEPVDGTLKVHDAPLGIMTNAPTYDWHMTNLQNYINLSVKDVEGAKLGPVTLAAFGSGSGLHGMPGDFTPPSRFVRAAIYSQSAAPNDTAEDAVLSAFHILNQFDIPKGAVQNSAIGGTVDEITEWTSVADLKNSALVFPDLRRSVDPHGRSEGGGRCRQGRDAHHQDGRHDATHRQRLDEFRRREVADSEVQSPAGQATRWPIACLEAYGQIIRQRPRKPRFQIASRIERRCPGRGIARRDIADVRGRVPNALHGAADPDGVRRLARTCKQQPGRQK